MSTWSWRSTFPGNVSGSRLQLLDGYGAEVTLTDPQEGMDGAIETARALGAADPAAARRLASSLREGVVATGFPDDAAKYGDDPLWSDA